MYTSDFHQRDILTSIFLHRPIKGTLATTRGLMGESAYNI